MIPANDLFLFKLQKGCSYHGIVYEQVIDQGKGGKDDLIATNSHIQVLDQTSLQDSDTVVAIVIQSLIDFKKANPEVEEVILKSDNAGCYHSASTIIRLWAHRESIVGLKILGIHFGEPGK